MQTITEQADNAHAPTAETVVWSDCAQGNWRFRLAATSEGLCYADTHDEAEAELGRWARRHCPGRPLVRDDGALRVYAEQLTAYWQGKLRRFEGALDLRGTSFQRDVWQALLDIPFGETRSYAEIAQAIGRPSAVRAVGAAIGANPVLVIVPCHRVIGKSGALTGFRAGLPMKTELLGLEGRNNERRGQKSGETR